MFKVYDTNKDGSISTEEFDAIATNFPFIDSFGVIDVNRWELVLSLFVQVVTIAPEACNSEGNVSLFYPVFTLFCMVTLFTK